MTFAEIHVKRSVILTDRLGPDILLVLRVRGQISHRERAQLKVPGFRDSCDRRNNLGLVLF